MKEKKYYVDEEYDEEEYDEDLEYDEEYDEDYDHNEELDKEIEYNKDEYSQYQPEKTTGFHNSNNFSTKNYIDNITHKEISRDIKDISRNTLHRARAIIIISGIIGILYCIFGIMIGGEAPGLGFIMAIICILATIGTLNAYYYIFLLSTGFAALIEDVNHIKKSLVKIDEQNDFDDLPRL